MAGLEMFLSQENCVITTCGTDAANMFWRANTGYEIDISGIRKKVENEYSLSFIVSPTDGLQLELRPRKMAFAHGVGWDTLKSHAVSFSAEKDLFYTLPQEKLHGCNVEKLLDDIDTAMTYRIYVNTDTKSITLKGSPAHASPPPLLDLPFLTALPSSSSLENAPRLSLPPVASCNRFYYCLFAVLLFAIGTSYQVPEIWTTINN